MDNSTTVSPQLFVRMVLSAWDTQNASFLKLLDTLTDVQWSKEIAPGRNTGIYLAGHLITVSDGMLPVLGFGPRLYPAWEEIFLRNPDKSGLERPPLAALKEGFSKINAELSSHFETMTASAWFDRHMSVSEEDFAREPHRNKLNIVINRTNHLSNHLGQLLLLKEREA